MTSFLSFHMYGLSSIWVAFHIPYSIRRRMEYGVWIESLRHITANFSLYQSQLKAKLQSAVSKIHISSDLWTSPHRHGVLAVCARWVDEDYQPRRALLSLPEIRHSHSGEHQSRIIFSTLDIYDIAN